MSSSSSVPPIVSLDTPLDSPQSASATRAPETLLPPPAASSAASVVSSTATSPSAGDVGGESLQSSTAGSSVWTRRDWVSGNMAALVASCLPLPSFPSGIMDRPRPGTSPRVTSRSPDWDVLVTRAVEAAQAAGAQHAVAQLTSRVMTRGGGLEDFIGIGVRALVNGYWGFAAVPSAGVAEVERVAQAAVAQARVNAQGTPRTVVLGTVPAAVGNWRTPIRIDPFTIPWEEWTAYMQHMSNQARRYGLIVRINLKFTREERVVATSEGAHFTQTVYEGGGQIAYQEPPNPFAETKPPVVVNLPTAGKGWELILDADIPTQLLTMKDRIAAQAAALKAAQPMQVGRYTVVCDGATMASILDRTLGMATQLDRALGYESNAGGTSYLSDPLGMLGTFQAASPLVTVTANRSAPGQLATVKWDTEGVEPQPFTLVKDGVLVDYQTTREQAPWLAPYYARTGQPIQSHGCAASDTALCIPMQHMPNLGLTPAATDVTEEELIANVKGEGILIRGGKTRTDFQCRTGELELPRTSGEMYTIRDGRIGPMLQGGMVLFDSLDLWRNVVAVGGASTQAVEGMVLTLDFAAAAYAKLSGEYPAKGQPPQFCNYSVAAPAATITGQAFIDPSRKS